jgi:hypothetical protein
VKAQGTEDAAEEKVEEEEGEVTEEEEVVYVGERVATRIEFSVSSPSVIWV